MGTTILHHHGANPCPIMGTNGARMAYDEQWGGEPWHHHPGTRKAPPRGTKRQRWSKWSRLMVMTMLTTPGNAAGTMANQLAANRVHQPMQQLCQWVKQLLRRRGCAVVGTKHYQISNKLQPNSCNIMVHHPGHHGGTRGNGCLNNGVRRNYQPGTMGHHPGCSWRRIPFEQFPDPIHLTPWDAMAPDNQE